MYYLYILKSIRTGKYYVGSTKNPNKRLYKHNNGSVRSTKSGRPWKIIYKECFNTVTEARKREKQIKSWKKRSRIENLIKRTKSLSSSLA
ncbi:GIY-YIG nuclease family protein [Candidatus Microgenomates bacterium]|nr:GIY-YIG nuclease family protein [Candidatus Microgenomates bacterium]